MSLRAAAVAIGLVVTLAAPDAFATGKIDRSFGTEGHVVTNFAGADGIADVALQADGKIVAVGGSASGNFSIARYRPDGRLDASFSGDGKVTTDFFDSKDAAKAVTIQPDGRIVVAGYATKLEGNLALEKYALARYDADGSLDTKFDVDGKATWGSERYQQLHNVAVAADGSLLVVGWIDAATEQFELGRVAANGFVLDSGRFDLDANELDAGVAELVVQPDGKVVVGGTRNMADGTADFALVRLTPALALDTSFSGDGMIRGGFGFDGASYDLTLQANGRIVIAGTSRGNFAVARLTGSGSRDESFSGDGVTTIDFREPSALPTTDIARGVGIDSAGRISLAGSTSRAVGLARLTPAGGLDDDFSEDGRASTDFSEVSATQASASGMVVQADDGIVAAGTARVADDSDFALVRYHGETAAPDTTLTAGPAAQTEDTTPTFRFTSSESGSTFGCVVDGQSFAECSSPYTSDELTLGTHTFRVRARDAAGNVDATPAEVTFEVVASTPTPTPTPSPTASPTPTPDPSPSPTATPTPESSPTATPTPESTPTASPTPEVTTSPTPVWTPPVVSILGRRAILRRDRRIVIRLACGDFRCGGWLTLTTRGGGRLDREHFSIAAGTTGRVTLRISTFGALALRARKVAIAAVSGPIVPATKELRIVRR